LIILTDVDCVYLDFLSPQRRPLRQASVAEAEAHLHNGEFLPGSMAPKIEAAIAFLRVGGQRVLIGLPEELPRLLEGDAGTTLLP
jgi:carbamate kinase